MKWHLYDSHISSLTMTYPELFHDVGYLSRIRRQMVQCKEKFAVWLANKCKIKPVGCHDDHRRHVVFQGAVEEGEALDVEHVDFVNKEDARSYLSLALFPPFRNLRVDLVSNLKIKTCWGNSYMLKTLWMNKFSAIFRSFKKLWKQNDKLTDQPSNQPNGHVGS